MLISEDEDAEWYTEYRSSDYNSSYSGHPYFSIIYVNSSGLEDRFSYHSQSVGRAGAGSINNYSGNLTFVHEDASIENGTMPISLSHVYNVNDRTVDIGYGNGWRLNYSQAINRVSLQNRTGTETYYRLTDGDGTRHYYRAGSGGYVNELDKDSILAVNGSTITITNKGDDQLVFACDSGAANGRLTAIHDANGNEINISYASTSVTDLRISSITEKRSGGSGGQSLTLSYNSSNQLSDVSAPDGLNTSYSYSNSNLTQIGYSDNKTVAYTYDGNNCLTKATNIDNYNVNYSYTTAAPYRVLSANEAAGSTEGQSISYHYGWGTTSITDNLNRITTYQFNNNGQPVSIRDPEGRAVFVAYNKAERTVTEISAVSKMQRTTLNRLTNHGFESSSSSAWSRSSSSNAAYSTTYAHTGKTSLKLENGGSTAVYATQSASVAAGKTYTFSCYFTGLSGALVQVLNGSTVLSQSDPVEMIGTTGSDWVRAVATFTVPSGVSSVTVKILLPADSAGTVYADSAQFESSATPNRYNMLENPDFDTLTSWTKSSTIQSDEGLANVGLAESHPTDFSDSVFRFRGGNGQYEKYIEQSVPVNGKAGDTYSFGIWMMSNANALCTQSFNGRQYGVKKLTLEFISGSNVVNTATASGTADTDDFQYLCGSAVAEGNYSSIRYRIHFNYALNKLFCDGAQLYREEFSQAYTYDSNGNLSGYTSLLGHVDSFKYDSGNNITEDTDARGNKTTHTYDNNHNRLTSTSPEGIVTTNTYNTQGQVTETRIGSSSTFIRTATAYDSSSGLTSVVTDARGNTVETAYNAAKRLTTRITDARGNDTDYTYDSLNRVSSITSGNSGVSYSYSSDRLTGVSVDGAVAYGLTYDVFGRTQTTTAGGTALSSNTYSNDSGLLLQTQFANGLTVTYSYDTLDRPVEVKYNGSSRYLYTYDDEGNLYAAKDVLLGTTIYYEYDHAGRCMASTTKNASGNTIASYKYHYDENNNLTSLACSTDGSAWQTTYVYDKDNRPISTTLVNGTVLSNSYDAIGRLSSRSIGNIHTATFSYLAGVNGSETAMLASYQNGSDSAFQYNYDADGNITHIQQGSDHIYYQYDALNQLIREDNSSENRSIVYTYDDRGNLLSKVLYPYAANGAALGTAADTISYAYQSAHQGWADQLTSYNGQNIRYDASGNPTTYRGYTMTWQGRRLMSATNGTNTVSYTYDENGIRTQKTVNGTATSYRYHGSVLISQVTGNDKLLFSYDANGNVVAVNYNGTYYYYVRNGQGDIVKLIDGNGSAVVEYSYDSWGKSLAVTETLASTLGALNPFRYRGYVYDTETRLYYLQSRYYDPEVGRFLNADIYVSTGQGVLGHNMYAYCGNNPVVRADDEGDFWNLVIGAAVGAVIGGITTAITTYNSETGVDWGKVAASAAAGAVSGLISATGAGMIIQAGACATIAAAETATHRAIDNRRSQREWSVEDSLACLDSALIGFASSIAGSCLSNITPAGRRVKDVTDTTDILLKKAEQASRTGRSQRAANYLDKAQKYVSSNQRAFNAQYCWSSALGTLLNGAANGGIWLFS